MRHPKHAAEQHVGRAAGALRPRRQGCLLRTGRRPRRGAGGLGRRQGDRPGGCARGLRRRELREGHPRCARARLRRLRALAPRPGDLRPRRRGHRCQGCCQAHRVSRSRGALRRPHVRDVRAPRRNAGRRHGDRPGEECDGARCSTGPPGRWLVGLAGLDPDRRWRLQRLSRVHAEVRGQLEDRGDERCRAALGRSLELDRLARAIRRLLPHRRLPREGGLRVRRAGGDRSRRCAAEGRRRRAMARCCSASSQSASSATGSSASSKPATDASELSAVLFVNPGSGKGGPTVEELTSARARTRRRRCMCSRRTTISPTSRGKRMRRCSAWPAATARWARSPRWPSSGICPSSASRGARATTSRATSGSTPTIRWRRSRRSGTASSGGSTSAA